MTRRNKKYDRNRALRVEARNSLRKFALVHVVGVTKTVQLFNLETMTDCSHLITKQIAELIGLPWKWRVTCSVLLRRQDGEQRETNVRVDCKNAYRHSQPELLELLNGHHQRLLKEMNPLQVITCGWIAQPVEGVDVSDADAYDIYEKYGAFENLSKYEDECLRLQERTQLEKLVG